LALFATTPGFAWAKSEPIEPDVAKSYVNELGSTALALLTSPNISPEDQARKFTVLMIQNIDFRQLSKRVLGATYRKGSDAEREEFARYFAAYFIDTVVGMLNGLQVTGFKIGKIRTYPNREVVVSTKIGKGDGKAFDAGWRLAAEDGIVKIVDILVEGASAAGHFRNQIAHGTQSSNIKGNTKKLEAQLKDSLTVDIVQSSM
jgi:ABC-type transporter MlaC component